MKQKKAALICLFLVGASLGYLVSLENSKKSRSIAPVVTFAKSAQAKISSTDVHSPDGKMNVSITKEPGQNGQMVSIAKVSDVGGAREKILVERLLGENERLVAPPNSWSPDDRFLFLREEAAGKTSFLLFRADGALFPDGKPFFDVVPLFNGRKTGETLSDVTGWDSDTLLHVFTTTDKGRGPSYWFDVPSRAFFVLGTR